MAHRPEWQLPRGVSRGVWHYTQANYIAERYDEYFAGNQLFEFDEQVIADAFGKPGRVVDLGCGTGRTLAGLARRGFWGVGVDLSPAMLRIVADKAQAENLPIHCVRANLVELDCLRDASFDYATCMFSTLGMIRGRENRHRMLTHIRRLLQPGGVFVLHVHNQWFNLFDPAGRRWLMQHWASVLMNRNVERGDKYFHYRGVPQMYLHTFTRREFLRVLKAAGFRVEKLVPLDVTRQRALRHRWLLGGLRANGWIAVCR